MDESEVFPKAILFLENLVKHSQTSADLFEGEYDVIKVLPSALYRVFQSS
jgi:hypothetical protein